MTSLDFRSRETCVVCACRLQGLLTGSFRVNKNSLRATSGTLSFLVRDCPECGHPTPPTATRWALSAKSVAAVRDVRVRRGWAA